MAAKADLPLFFGATVDLFGIDQPAIAIGRKGSIEELLLGVQQCKWLGSLGIAQHFRDERGRIFAPTFQGGCAERVSPRMLSRTAASEAHSRSLFVAALRLV